MTTVTLPITTRARVSLRAAASGYCTPTPSGWFPVAPGTTLPEAPAPTTNPTPLPPNSVEAPEDWNPDAPDLCYLFQDILPVSTPPVFPETLNAPAVAPYLETVRLDAAVRLGVGISTYPYSFTPVTVSLPLRLRTAIDVAPSILVAAGAPASISLTTHAPTVAAGGSVFPPSAVIAVATHSPYEPEAAYWISRVEAADGSALETAVREAINTFVRGCKVDGTLNSLKAACIMAGARTLAGALVPLVGPAPTNNGFISSDYDRKTGLLGSTKWLNSNRNNDADPQDNKHLAVYVSVAATGTSSQVFIGSDSTATPGTSLIYKAGSADGSTDKYIANINQDLGPVPEGSSANSGFSTGLMGASRSSSSTFIGRVAGANTTYTQTSETPSANPVVVFARTASSPARFTNARMSFYSLGEAVDLTLLDNRLATLMSDLAAAIP